MANDLYDHPSQFQQEATPNVASTTTTTDLGKCAEQQQRKTLLLVGGGVGVLLLVVMFLGQSMLQPQTPLPTPAPTSAPAVAVAPPTAQATSTPTCPPVTYYLKIIADQEEKANWDAAAATALSALSDETLCEGDSEILEQKYVTNAMNGLYARKFGADKASQEEVVQTYQTIKRRAQDFQVAFDSPLVVAQRAAQGKYLLMKHSHDEAIAGGTFNTADQGLIIDYVSNLYNIGYHWTYGGEGNRDYHEGLRYLSASNHVARKHETGQAEAWGLLKQFLGPDESTWSEPIDTPLLKP